jgi:hypothetical protein
MMPDRAAARALLRDRRVAEAPRACRRSLTRALNYILISGVNRNFPEIGCTRGRMQEGLNPVALARLRKILLGVTRTPRKKSSRVAG